MLKEPEIGSTVTLEINVASVRSGPAKDLFKDGRVVLSIRVSLFSSDSVKLARVCSSNSLFQLNGIGRVSFAEKSNFEKRVTLPTLASQPSPISNLLIYFDCWNNWRVSGNLPGQMCSKKSVLGKYTSNWLGPKRLICSTLGVKETNLQFLKAMPCSSLWIA